MCVVSMVGDFYADKWRELYKMPPQTPAQQPVIPSIWPVFNNVSREEFDALKLEVLTMKELLKRAKLYDEQTGQPNCEMDEKVAMLKKIAEAVGVDLSEVFGKK